MASGLKSSTLELLKRFNRAFPQFYEQFVSSEIQLQNLRLAHQLYKTRQAVIELNPEGDRKSTRLNSSHANISYAVFCLKKKKTDGLRQQLLQLADDRCI